MKFISPAAPTYIHRQYALRRRWRRIAHIWVLCVWHYVNGNMCGAVAANHSIPFHSTRFHWRRQKNSACLGMTPDVYHVFAAKQKKSSFNKVNIIWHPKQKTSTRKREREREKKMCVNFWTWFWWFSFSHHIHTHTHRHTCGLWNELFAWQEFYIVAVSDAVDCRMVRFRFETIGKNV